MDFKFFILILKQKKSLKKIGFEFENDFYLPIIFFMPHLFLIKAFNN